MANLLIRDMDTHLHARLQAAAARHHRSMEEEACELLRVGVAHSEAPENQVLIVELARQLFGPESGVELDIPPRNLMPERPPPDFTDCRITIVNPWGQG